MELSLSQRNSNITFQPSAARTCPTRCGCCGPSCPVLAANVVAVEITARKGSRIALRATQKTVIKARHRPAPFTEALGFVGLYKKGPDPPFTPSYFYPASCSFRSCSGSRQSEISAGANLSPSRVGRASAIPAGRDDQYDVRGVDIGPLRAVTVECRAGAAECLITVPISNSGHRDRLAVAHSSALPLQDYLRRGH